MKRLALGLVIGLVIPPLVLVIFLIRVQIPVAVTDKPFKWEENVAQKYLNHRIHRDMPKNAPMDADVYNLQSGMMIYRSQCASCHGIYGQTSSFAQHMYPQAPELWKLHPNGSVGVSDDPVGETYWKVANGIRLTGMPAYKGILNDTQVWQVSLLLSNANKPLPYEVLELLKKPLPTEPLPAAIAPNQEQFPGLPELPKLPVAPVPPSK